MQGHLQVVLALLGLNKMVKYRKNCKRLISNEFIRFFARLGAHVESPADKFSGIERYGFLRWLGGA
jgi:hypothetical protein